MPQNNKTKGPITTTIQIVISTRKAKIPLKTSQALVNVRAGRQLESEIVGNEKDLGLKCTLI